MPKLSRAEIEYRQVLYKLGLPVAKPDDGKHIWLENKVTGELLVSNCRKWSCERCAPRMSGMWARRLLGEHVDYFLTITLVPEILEDARWSWREFCQRWRRKVGPFEYVKFTERGSKNLMKHYHILIRSDAPSIDLAWLRGALTASGYGLQNKLRRFVDDEHRRRSIWYCAKYCTKNGTAGFLETERKVETSRKFFTNHDSLTLSERVEWEMEQAALALRHTHLIPEGVGDPTYQKEPIGRMG